jgi:hypothetical protein
MFKNNSDLEHNWLNLSSRNFDGIRFDGMKTDNLNLKALDYTEKLLT